MCEENIRATLKGYVTDQSKWFFWYHDLGRLQQIWNFKKIKKENENEMEMEDPFLKDYYDKYGHPEDVLCGFLDSTLDESRLKKANDFSKYALYISDKRSFAYFRSAESKREISG